LKQVQIKKQNSGNQPEFQSSIKKRTVNQTVVILNILGKGNFIFAQNTN